jgi:hypothetical protein
VTAFLADERVVCKPGEYHLFGKAINLSASICSTIQDIVWARAVELNQIENGRSEGMYIAPIHPGIPGREDGIFCLTRKEFLEIVGPSFRSAVIRNVESDIVFEHSETDQQKEDLASVESDANGKENNMQKAVDDDTFPEVFTAAELKERKFPPLRWHVEDILPSGVTLFAGPPKSGKTRVMTHVAVAVVTGGKAFGKINTKKAKVLCLWLEDSERRVRERFSKLFSNGWPDGLYCVTEWPTMNNGGIERLDRFLDSHPHVKLVIIDVWERFRPPAPRGSSIYSYDYRSIAAIKATADKHDVAIVLIHHTNKLLNAPDVFNRVSGTHGLTGAVDTMMLLEREDRLSQEATLSIDGREVEAQELLLEHDLDTGQWTLIGDANLYVTTDPRREIISYLEENPNKLPSEVAKALNKHPSTTRSNMRNMARDGQLVRDQKKRYSVAKSR